MIEIKEMYQLAGYAVYLVFTVYITVFVGRSFFRSGAVFLLDIFRGDTRLTQVCNRFLLTGYYLVNLGYAAVSVNFWNETHTFTGLAEELSFRLGVIICGLAMLHYFNMYTLVRFNKHIGSLYHHQSYKL